MVSTSRWILIVGTDGVEVIRSQGFYEHFLRNVPKVYVIHKSWCGENRGGQLTASF